MASRSFAALRQGARGTLDVPVAALAGLSVAVIAFAMPGDLLGDLVGATGLPSIVSAAEPPLGFKARIGLGAGGAVLMFAFTFLLLRWLEKFGKRRAAPREEEEELTLEVEGPRLRRRDIHPDAPARPPLLAAHELGEPDLGYEARYVAWPSAPTEAPVAADPAPAPEMPRAPEPHWSEPEPVQSRDDSPAMDDDDSQAAAFALSQRRWTEMEEAEPASEPDFGQPWAVEESSEAEHGFAEEPEPEIVAEPPAPEPEPPAPQWVPEQRFAEANPWSPPEPVAETPEPVAERPQPGSIPDLMARLEQGLARRRVVPEAPVAAAPEPAVPPADNDRLQNAIDSLQRFASRQD